MTQLTKVKLLVRVDSASRPSCKLIAGLRRALYGHIRALYEHYTGNNYANIPNKE